MTKMFSIGFTYNTILPQMAQASKMALILLTKPCLYYVTCGRRSMDKAYKTVNLTHFSQSCALYVRLQARSSSRHSWGKSSSQGSTFWSLSRTLSTGSSSGTNILMSWPQSRKRCPCSISVVPSLGPLSLLDKCVRITPISALFSCLPSRCVCIRSP